MKKLAILCLLIAAYITCPKNASAQYKSIFGDSSTSWSMVQCYQYVDGGDVSDSFHIAEDTLIGNNNYRKIIRTDFRGREFNESFIKEDTANGTVWMKFNSRYDTSERMVMNLNLQLGDSFPLYDYDGKLRKMMIVDSVYFLDSLKHIQFNELTKCTGKYNAVQKVTFIEGIGSNAYFEYTTGRGILLCYFKDGQKVYTSEFFGGVCKIYHVGIEENNPAFKSLKLYPNPTNGSGIITFQNDKNTCVNLEIFDLNGKRIFSSSSKTPYITFDINASENGVYIYKLMNEKGEFSSGKILKQ